ncbi:MAG: hypothetical protein C0444_09870 [Microbacterium sp.]|nr:hypothetical protein [Microbacterium sp.]MBA4345518.1 hypothetical protein [Microbacterium sp.]
MRRLSRSSLALALLGALVLTPSIPAGAAVGVWRAPVTLSAPGQDSSQPWIVSDGNTMTTVWAGNLGSNRIHAASSTDGGTSWSPSPNPLSPFGQAAWDPRVVTDGTTITALWVFGDFRIQATSSANGGSTWSNPATLSAPGENAFDPQLVTDGTTITALWSQSDDGISLRVQATSSTDGGLTWGVPVALSDAGQSASNPKLVTDGERITAVWSRYDGSNFRIQSRTSINGGATWGPATNLSAPRQGAGQPHVVTDGTTITAIWRRYDGSNSRIQAASSIDGGTTWSTPATLSPSGQDAYDPQVATDGTTITAIWRRYDGSNERIQTRSTTNGGTTWSTTATLSPSGQDAKEPQVVTDGTTTTIVWSVSDGNNSRVQAAASTNGGTTWSTPATLSPSGQDAEGPQVVTDGTETTIVWSVSDGSNRRIEASSFTELFPARLAGNNRYETSVAISSVFDPNVPVVYLATGTNYPDALSAASAAAVQGGPLLLTTPTSLPTVVRDELVRLNPALVVIAGRTGVVSADVEAAVQLALPSATVRRDAGANRYATSRIIAERAFAEDTTTTAYIATGANFPDALSASAAAGAAGVPVILVNGTGPGIDSETQDLLTTLGVTDVVIAGGTGVVTTTMESSLKAILGESNVVRLSGANRYETSVAINGDAFTSADTVFLATGLGFADALAGAALAGNAGAPLYVVPPTCVPPAVLTDLSALGTRFVVLLGGTGVLSTSVASLTAC